MKILHISLFSGMGGFDLAAEWMGWENAASCEINPFGNRILNYYWPNAYHHKDVKDFTYETVNAELCKRFGNDWRSKYKLVISGGFPCQPYSSAGKQLGTADDRHLWPEMLRIIREFQPDWVVGENVRGLTNWNGGLVFDEVQSDLEAAGYEVTPFLLPACAVDAPHRRDRIWFVAYSYFGQLSIRVPDWIKKNISENTTGMDDRSSRFSYNDVITNSKCKSRDRRAWENFPTQPPVCSGNDGISYRLDSTALLNGRYPRQPWKAYGKWRNESIKAAGNAIVPQVVYQIFKAIEKYENIS